MKKVTVELNEREVNKLSSLEGAPEKVGRGFYCLFNKLTQTLTTE